MESLTDRTSGPLTGNRHVLDSRIELCVSEDARPRLELIVTTDLDPSDYRNPNWKDLLKAVENYLKTFGAAQVVRFKRIGT